MTFQQPMFEGWAVQRITIKGIPGFAAFTANPVEPPFGFEALFPDGRIPQAGDTVAYQGTLKVAEIGHGSTVDQKTGSFSSEFDRTIVFKPIQPGFEVVRFDVSGAAAQARDTA